MNFHCLFVSVSIISRFWKIIRMKSNSGNARLLDDDDFQTIWVSQILLKFHFDKREIAKSD